MKTARPIGAGLVVVAALGGCRQLIGYEDPIVVEALCANGKRDGDETGKDCGGSCSACADGEGCKTGADCVSKVCSSGGLCLAPACDDEVRNGGETDTDCGGETCGGCGPGLVCKVDGDCKNKECVGGRCASICTDGLKGGAETDVDCGGGAASGCALCVDGKACKTGEDCESRICRAQLCAKAYVWGDYFEGAAVSAVTADVAGRTMLAGTISSTCNFGGGPLSDTTSSGLDFFVAGFDTVGAYSWAKQFVVDGVPGSSALNGLAAYRSGGANLVATFHGTAHIGSQTLSAVSLGSSLLAQLDPAGNVRWASAYGISGFTQLTSVASDQATGNVIAAGALVNGSVSFGGGVLTGAGGYDILIAAFGDGGNHLWSKRLGDAADQAAQGVATDSGGNVVVVGYMFGDVDFGKGPVSSTGDADVFVTKYDADGNPMWTKLFGDTARQMGTHLAVDGGGNIFVAGTYRGTIDLGGGALPDNGGRQVFLAKLDASGNHLWSKQLADISLRGLTTDEDGRILGTGYFRNVVADFGGGPIQAADKERPFAFVFDGAGNHVWSSGFVEASNNAEAVGIAWVKPNAIVAGTFNGMVDLGGGPTTALSDAASFMAAFTPP